MDVNLYSYHQDRENTEVYNCVNQNGYTARAHVPELHHSRSRWNLKQ